jgi:hypothetical protein
MARKRKSKEIIHQNDPIENKPKSDHVQFVFTLISIGIAVIGILFTYVNYKNSLPQVRLEDWKIEILQPAEISRSSLLFITADISNVSNLTGSTVSLVKPDSEITYESVPLTAITTVTTVAISLPTPTTEQLLIPIESGKYRIVMEFPSITDPQKVLCSLKQTGLLEFTDVRATPTNNRYTLNDKELCFGENDCRPISNNTLPSVLAFSGDQQKIITNLISGYVASDDIPISILPGETKRIFLTWYIPDSCNKLPSRPKILNITLNFNNKQTIVIHVMDKLKTAP